MNIQYATANTFKYVSNGDNIIYSTVNTQIIDLGSPSVVNSPITIRNSNAFSITIKSGGDNILILAGKSTARIFVDLAKEVISWVVLEVVSKELSLFEIASPLIPILLAPDSPINKDRWGTDASSTVADSYFPFSIGPAQWVPVSLGAEWLSVSNPIPFIVKYVMICPRGATLSDFHGGCKIQGGASFVDLVSIPDSFMQTATPFSIALDNSTPYSSYRFYITSSFGTIADLGIFNMQYYGYYKTF